MEDNEIRGIGIFNAGKEQVKEIMDEDPGVKQGVFIYEIIAVKSFEGDSL
jgi:hypothetical protein